MHFYAATLLHPAIGASPRVGRTSGPSRKPGETMADDERDEELDNLYRSIFEMSMRAAARNLEPQYGFPWKFDRTRYSNNYLVQRVSEEHVQSSIIEHLEFYRIDVIAIDAGMKRARGRMAQAAARVGIDVSQIVNFKSGGLPAGFSDLHATIAPAGIGLYIEVKAPAWIDPDNPSRIIREAGKPTSEQLVFLDSKHLRGAICLVAWSVDDVMRVVRELAEENRAFLGRPR